MSDFKLRQLERSKNDSKEDLLAWQVEMVRSGLAVWLLTRGDYSDYHVVDVCTSRARWEASGTTYPTTSCEFYAEVGAQGTESVRWREIRPDHLAVQPGPR